MTKVTRIDDISFVIPEYRELLVSKKPALLKNEIQSLAQSYGEYVYIQKNTADSTYEVAFSEDEGYLLAESIAKHFNNFENFIYCETMPDSSEALFVVMKEGSVYIDKKTHVNSVIEEINILKTQQESFDFYIHGHVPLTTDQTNQDFHYVGDICKTFNREPKSIYSNLAKYDEFKITSLDIAFKNNNLSTQISPRTLGAIAAAIVIVILLWVMWPSSTEETQAPVKQVIRVNPYQAYINALSTPDPRTDIAGVMTLMQTLQTLPAGWAVASISTNAFGATTVNLTTPPGPLTSLDTLNQWASQASAKMSVTDNGVRLYFNTSYQNRLSPKTIYSAQAILRTLIDRLSMVLPSKSIKVQTANSNGNYKEISLSIFISNDTAARLQLISNQLSGLPLTFTSMEANVDKGQLTGTIKLKIIGN